MAFLRALRTLRLLRSYPLLARLRVDFPYFRTHEDVIISAARAAARCATIPMRCTARRAARS
jgi:voltage-gated potassium channel